MMSSSLSLSLLGRSNPVRPHLRAECGQENEIPLRPFANPALWCPPGCARRGTSALGDSTLGDRRGGLGFLMREIGQIASPDSVLDEAARGPSAGLMGRRASVCPPRGYLSAPHATLLEPTILTGPQSKPGARTHQLTRGLWTVECGNVGCGLLWIMNE